MKSGFLKTNNGQFYEKQESTGCDTEKHIINLTEIKVFF